MSTPTIERDEIRDRGGRRVPLAPRVVRHEARSPVGLAAGLLGTLAMTVLTGLAVLDPRGLPFVPRTPAESPASAAERVVFVEPPRPETPAPFAPLASLPPDERGVVRRAPSAPASIAFPSARPTPPTDTTASASASRPADPTRPADAPRRSVTEMAYPTIPACGLACVVSRPKVFGRRIVPTYGPERDSVLRATSARVAVLGRRAIAVPQAELDSIAREQAMGGAQSRAPGRGIIGAGVSIPMGLPGGGPSAEERARMRRQQAAADSVLARLTARARMQEDSLRLAREDSVARARDP